MLKTKELIPTTVTLGNMICGFISVLCVLNQKFEIAAWLIVAAMALDAFDGKLARIMNSTSRIGAQLDSMADLITFGIAPAVLIVKACSHLPHVILWGIGLFFLMCTAFRLARFNAQKDEGKDIPKHFFAGLPTTLSGGTVAQLIILNHFLRTSFGIDTVITLLPFITFLLGIVMVSKIPFFNITGKIGIQQGIPAMVLEFSAAILFFIITPQLALSTTLSCYLIICIMYGVIKGKQIRKGYSPQRSFS
ncbi:MAG: CDP-diacylglycerol--serine O-phosphatidyltransferase [wastewater metagenome]|nr:CDP-diacylglycerol--serine O-phosphatidyltransferase [Candidatus Loosdrechtia aerotolerans]